VHVLAFSVLPAASCAHRRRLAALPHRERASDAHNLPLAQDIRLLVTEECVPGWAIVYRGMVVSAWTTRDLAALEG
jgi:hypothetical protein